MTDFFLTAGASVAGPREWDRGGHMLGSIDWGQVALLAQVLVGVEYDYDDLAWEAPRGDLQLGRVPERFTQSLATLPDDVSQVARSWFEALRDEAGWAADATHTLPDDLHAMRHEAKIAVGSGGALWLRIEP